MQSGNNQIVYFIVITTGIIILLASLIISLLYLYQKRHHDYSNKLNALKLDFEKNLLQTQVEIQEQTFENISREIHDNISLSLTLAKLNLNTLDWLDIEKTYHSVKSSNNIIAAAITDLSNLSKCMNPDVIRNLGLMKAVKNEVERLEQMAHLNICYNIEGEAVFMDSEKELVIFRIIQEAFNNILRHAEASKVWLQFSYNHDYLDILIKDDGIGFNKEEVLQTNSHCAGLNNMQTRAKLFGGKVIFESARKSGTKILVTVPYKHHGIKN